MAQYGIVKEVAMSTYHNTELMNLVVSAATKEAQNNGFTGEFNRQDKAKTLIFEDGTTGELMQLFFLWEQSTPNLAD
jgi:hypothetical protein